MLINYVNLIMLTKVTDGRCCAFPPPASLYVAFKEVLFIIFAVKRFFLIGDIAQSFTVDHTFEIYCFSNYCVFDHIMI